MKRILFFVLILVQINLFAQEPFAQWSASDTETETILNFNPSHSFDRELANNVELDLNTFDSRAISVVAVCSPLYPMQEQVLWQLCQNDTVNMMMTTHRLADLVRFEYLNFDKKIGPKHFVRSFSTSSFHRARNKDIKLVIGGQPKGKNLPATALTGLVSEVLVFDRMLSPIERYSIESRLALKYGITLPAYVDSEGNIIWSADSTFKFNVAGIAADGSALQQKQGKSSNSPKEITLALGDVQTTNIKNREELAIGSSLIWADNGASPVFDKKIQGLPIGMERQWKISATNDIAATTTLLFPTEKPDTAEIWLAIAENSEAGFGQPNVYFQKGIFQKGDAKFTGLIWDKDHSGDDVFSFFLASDFFIKAWKKKPNCKTGQTGSLIIGAEGGTAPYRFELFDKYNNLIWAWSESTTQVREIEELSAQGYIIRVKDAYGKKSSQYLFLESSDSPIPLLKQTYFLEQHSELILNGSPLNASESLRYQWIDLKTENTLSEEPEIHLTKAGNYRLIVDNQGCVSQTDFEVQGHEQSNFLSAVVSPNPSLDGFFSLSINLKKAAPLSVALTDVNGIILQSNSLDSSQSHVIQGKVRKKGIYFFSLISEQSSKILKFIVQ